MQSPQNGNALKNVTNTLYWLETVNQQDLVISGIKLAEKKVYLLSNFLVKLTYGIL